MACSEYFCLEHIRTQTLHDQAASSVPVWRALSLGRAGGSAARRCGRHGRGLGGVEGGGGNRNVEDRVADRGFAVQRFAGNHWKVGLVQVSYMGMLLFCTCRRPDGMNGTISGHVCVSAWECVVRVFAFQCLSLPD